jgi:hypothetical protein
MNLFFPKALGFGLSLFAAAACLAARPPAGTYDLLLENRIVHIAGRERPAMLINGPLPGPVLRFKEGEDVTFM